jgi:hypothetical protein
VAKVLDSPCYERTAGAQQAWADELGGEIGEADLHAANAILAQIVDVMASCEPTT